MVIFVSGTICKIDDGESENSVVNSGVRCVRHIGGENSRDNNINNLYLNFSLVNFYSHYLSDFNHFFW